MSRVLAGVIVPLQVKIHDRETKTQAKQRFTASGIATFLGRTKLIP